MINREIERKIRANFSIRNSRLSLALRDGAELTNAAVRARGDRCEICTRQDAVFHCSPLLTPLMLSDLRGSRELLVTGGVQEGHIASFD
jgi:hypothetical protein